MLSYALRLAPYYDGMVLATVPDVPEARALGRDDDEAIEQARCALDTALERYAAEGRPFPPARATGTLKVTTDRFACLESA